MRTQNLAWDAQTGQVLVTKTTNEFSDELYTLAYPAHWMYEGMGQAYRNIGNFLYGMTVSGNAHSFPMVENYLAPGDEVQWIPHNSSGVPNSSASQKGWVLEVDAANDGVYIIDINGAVLVPPNSEASVQVIRSGYRNQQQQATFTATFKQNPLKDLGTDGLPDIVEIDASKDILTAEGNEFKELWKTICLPEGVSPTPTNPCSCSGISSYINDLGILLDTMAVHWSSAGIPYQ